MGTRSRGGGKDAAILGYWDARLLGCWREGGGERGKRTKEGPGCIYLVHCDVLHEQGQEVDNGRARAVVRCRRDMGSGYGCIGRTADKQAGQVSVGEPVDRRTAPSRIGGETD